MTELLGIKFAPLNIPLERRLQTLGTLQWTLSFLFMGFSCLFFSIYLLFTDYYWVTLGYLCWYLYDRKTPEQGGRRVAFFREWIIWKYMRDYFPIKLIKTVDLDPNKNYILGYHPHGIMCTGAFLNFATDATGFPEIFPGLQPHLLTLAGQFMFPFFREYFMTTGSVSCSKESIRYLLTKKGTGNALILIVGGAVEALDARPGRFTVNITTRKGFVKLALENGASLVPVFSFGENDLYEQADNAPGTSLRSGQKTMMKYLGFSMPVFRGRGIFNYTLGILPFRTPVNTVVGAPIDVEKTPAPTKKQIDELHEKYIAGLTAVFEENKTKYGIDEKQHINFV